MAFEPVVIPEKIYFKIGEVCELVGVQAHVLRYWETEFSMLSPQKNKSGQRSYRRRDVEMALRIKQLLYNEMFTIAGAKKKLQAESREANKPKPSAPASNTPTSPEPSGRRSVEAPTLFDDAVELNGRSEQASEAPHYTPQQKDALRVVASHLLELRDMLKTTRI